MGVPFQYFYADLDGIDEEAVPRVTPFGGVIRQRDGPETRDAEPGFPLRSNLEGHS